MFLDTCNHISSAVSGEGSDLLPTLHHAVTGVILRGKKTRFVEFNTLKVREIQLKVEK